MRSAATAQPLTYARGRVSQVVFVIQQDNASTYASAGVFIAQQARCLCVGRDGRIRSLLVVHALLCRTSDTFAA